MITIPLKCSCGSFSGIVNEVSPEKNQRVVCMCCDCRAFTFFLGKQKEILDENGGTKVFPCYPAQIKFTKGLDQVRCVRLSDDGMIRWYTDCCKMPIANTLNSPQIPFGSLIHTILDLSGFQKSRDELLGPVTARVNAKYGYGKITADASNSAPPKMIFSTIKFLLKGRLTGQQKPSPFFNPETGKPTVAPIVQSDAQYDDLLKLCAALSPR